MKTVSVIMPTYNKGARLALTLTSFCYQKTSRQYEIILVDGGETPNLEACRFRSHLPLEILRVENLGRSFNRNVGINAAQGELLVFCDDDLIVEPSFIEEHCLAHDKTSNCLVHGWKNEIPYVKFFLDPRDPQKGLLGGHQREISDALKEYRIGEEQFPEIFDRIHQWGHCLDFLEKNVRHMFAHKIDNYHIPWLASCTANMSLPRLLAYEAGLFHESFGLDWGPEDLEFGYRVCRSGATVEDAPGAQNYHLSHTRTDWKPVAQRGFEKFQQMYPHDQFIAKTAELLLEKSGDIEWFTIA